MSDSGAKLVIEKEFMQFELNLQNNYKDIAYENYKEVHAMIDSFHEQGEISNWYFKRMKKKLKKYDEIYQLETEKEEKTENEE